jgi:uncharacterized protein (PEP-CTERM system associated)
MRIPVAAFSCLGLACMGAAAQDLGRRSEFSASFESSLAYIDTKGSPTSNGSDLALQVRPGFKYALRSGRVQGSMNYGLGLVHHSKDSSGSEAQNSLRAAFTAEAVPNWFFVDASAAATRSAISAFGRPALEGDLQSNQNSTDVGTVSLSPYVRGPIGDLATYTARWSANATNTRRSKVGDSSGVSRQLAVDSARSSARFGWGLSATSEHAAFRNGVGTDNERLQASVSVRPGPELRLSLRGGQERSNVLSSEGQRYDTWGAGIEWRPNERTQLNYNRDSRYFGQSHQLSLSHRLPLSSLAYSSSKSVSSSSDPKGIGRPLTQYDLYFLLFASEVPDPVQREEFVLTRLQIEGKDPNAIAIGGFVNSTVSLQRRNDLAWTYAGKRLGLTLQAYSTHNEQLQRQAGSTTDGTIDQKGYSSTLSWRLTPTSTASVSGQRLMTKPSLTLGGTDLKSLSLLLTEQVGRRTNANFGARYSVFNSETEPYRESSITASLSMRF